MISTRTPLSQILSLIASEAGLRFTVDQGINPKVTFSLENPTVQEVLDTILPGEGLDYMVMPDGMVRIGRAYTIMHSDRDRDSVDASRRRSPDENERIEVWGFYVYGSSHVSQELYNSLQSLKSENGKFVADDERKVFLIIDRRETIRRMKEAVEHWRPPCPVVYFAYFEFQDLDDRWTSQSPEAVETPTAVPETPVATPTPRPLAEHYNIESIVGKAAVLIDYTLKPITVREGTVVDDPLGKFEVVEIDADNGRLRVKLLFDGHEKWIEQPAR